MKVLPVLLDMNSRRQASQGLVLKRTFRRGLTLCLATTLWLAIAAPAGAAVDTLDQFQTDTKTSVTDNNTQMLAQTFTAGMTGQIDRVSVFIGQNFTTGGGTVEIQSATGGLPSGTTLGSASYAGFMPAAWRDFSFAGVPVTTGTQYAIVVIPSSTSGNTGWAAGKTTVYPGGHLWFGTQATKTWTYATTMGTNMAFMTWVVTGIVANQPPVLTEASTAVAGNEGSAATNSGTYSDADGDTVTLSASSGTVTPTNGNWVWTQAAADEAPTQTITITADDLHGATAVVSFTVTINGMAPTATITGAPATALEGTTVSLTGSATSPNPTDTSLGFAYSWTVTKNGGAFSTGTGPGFTFQPDDEGVYVVSLKATDDGTFSGTATATINGGNVAPTTTITSAKAQAAVVLASGATFTFTGHYSDPGTADTHTATWAFGDGTSSTSSLAASGAGDVTTTHAYAKAGTYSVSLTVADDDGGTSSATTSIAVQTPAQTVATLKAFTLHIYNGHRHNSSLTRTLDAAARALKRGQTQDACDLLYHFMSQVEILQDHNQMSSANASSLLASATSVRQTLGCDRPEKDHDYEGQEEGNR